MSRARAYVATWGNEGFGDDVLRFLTGRQVTLPNGLAPPDPEISVDVNNILERLLHIDRPTESGTREIHETTTDQLRALAARLPDAAELAARATTWGVPKMVVREKGVPKTLDVEQSVAKTSDIEKSVPTTSDIEQRVPKTLDVQTRVPTTSDIEQSDPKTSDIEQSVPTTSDIEQRVPKTWDVQTGVPTTSDSEQSVAKTSDVEQSVAKTSDVEQSDPKTLDIEQSVAKTSDIEQSVPKTSDIKQSVRKTSVIQKSVRKKFDVWEDDLSQWIIPSRVVPSSFEARFDALALEDIASLVDCKALQKFLPSALSYLAKWGKGGHSADVIWFLTGDTETLPNGLVPPDPAIPVDVKNILERLLHVAPLIKSRTLHVPEKNIDQLRALAARVREPSQRPTLDTEAFGTWRHDGGPTSDTSAFQQRLEGLSREQWTKLNECEGLWEFVARAKQFLSTPRYRHHSEAVAHYLMGKVNTLPDALPAPDPAIPKDVKKLLKTLLRTHAYGVFFWKIESTQKIYQKLDALTVFRFTDELNEGRASVRT
ncbi:hypothetical protein [Pandoraea oxalativorans]|uniref:hypothetical protein n=1 Tax=Pandoraea oxalativorans TaxID=573737 RepID=UPI0012F52991|nr:hypothetical protein [Pandoraea oxalativorans]